MEVMKTNGQGRTVDRDRNCIWRERFCMTYIQLAKVSSMRMNMCLQLCVCMHGIVCLCVCARAQVCVYVCVKYYMVRWSDTSLR